MLDWVKSNKKHELKFDLLGRELKSGKGWRGGEFKKAGKKNELKQ